MSLLDAISLTKGLIQSQSLKYYDYAEKRKIADAIKDKDIETVDRQIWTREESRIHPFLLRDESSEE